MPERCPDLGLTSATVAKEREQDRVVSVPRRVVLGSQQVVDQALKEAVCRRTIHNVIRGASHATDRGRNPLKARKMYRSRRTGVFTRR